MCQWFLLFIKFQLTLKLRERTGEIYWKSLNSCTAVNQDSLQILRRVDVKDGTATQAVITIDFQWPHSSIPGLQESGCKNI